MYNYTTLKQRIATHLVKNGFTWSVEDNNPPTLRNDIDVDRLLDSILEYMSKDGYRLQKTKE